MKKTIWTFGLISGGILSIMMAATIPFIDRIGFGAGEVLGYTTMVAAFLLVFFGIRSYRDNVLGGTIGFRRAFVVGTLITCIAGNCNLRRAVHSMPEAPGRLMSISTTSGFRPGICSSASSADPQAQSTALPVLDGTMGRTMGDEK